jgi:hypothetical protein
MMANYVYALRHPEVGPEFAAFAAKMAGSLAR